MPANTPATISCAGPHRKPDTGILLLQVEQFAFQVEASAIAAQRSTGCDYTVTGHDDRDRIAIVGHADGAERIWMPDDARDVGVAARLAVRDSEERLPARKLKRRPTKIKRHRKFAALAIEVLLKLARIRR